MVLTHRRRLIVEQCRDGKTIHEIARLMGVTPQRVSQHVQAIARQIAEMEYLPLPKSRFRDFVRVHADAILDGRGSIPIERIRALYPKPAPKAKRQLAQRLFAQHRAVGSGGIPGIVEPTICELCERTVTDGRRLIGHHTDYDKPLDVTFLCAPCHAEVHYFERIDGSLAQVS